MSDPSADAMEVEELREVLVNTEHETPKQDSLEEIELEGRVLEKFMAEVMEKTPMVSMKDIDKYLLQISIDLNSLGLHNAKLKRQAGVFISALLMARFYTCIQNSLDDYQPEPADIDVITKVFLKTAQPQIYADHLPRIFNSAIVLGNLASVNHVLRPFDQTETEFLKKHANHMTEELQRSLESREEQPPDVYLRLAMLHDAQLGLFDKMNTYDIPDRWQIVSPDWILTPDLSPETVKFASGLVLDASSKSCLLEVIKRRLFLVKNQMAKFEALTGEDKKEYQELAATYQRQIDHMTAVNDALESDGPLPYGMEVMKQPPLDVNNPVAPAPLQK